MANPAVRAGIPLTAPVMIPEAVTSRHTLTMNPELGGRSEEAPHLNAPALSTPANSVEAWPAAPAASSVRTHAGFRGYGNHSQLGNGPAALLRCTRLRPFRLDSCQVY
ncbi:hypothetical protein PHYPSEUDO_007801 [Phytophthora pseudosyringae]|uniref:Uncharacterized protein n=1 Tax=Phytophthora pseudosyringae TaxID=221518 RepID=A0A8T1VFZ3_9STRA|nr:hypothetical protein PHYPSEUDO_007801 [Phytophthora pseudosyringae]